MLWQRIAVGIIVAAALFWAARTIAATLRGKRNPCAWCDKDCPARRGAVPEKQEDESTPR